MSLLRLWVHWRLLQTAIWSETTSIQEPEVLYGGQDTGPRVTSPVTVPEGTVFCLGDNGPLSLDSRHRAIGPKSKEDLIGREVFMLRFEQQTYE